MALSSILKKKYSGYDIAYVYDEKTYNYIKDNYKKILFVSNNKDYSTMNLRSTKNKIYLLNAKNIYVKYEDINKMDIKKPFGKTTRMYINKMNACYNIITDKKLSQSELDTLNTNYKKIKIINSTK